MFRQFSSTASLPPTIRQLLSSTQKPSVNIQVNGWVKSIRRQKKVAFAAITDGSSALGLQAVFVDPELSRKLTNGACVSLSGKLTDSPGAGQSKELQVDSVKVLGECDPETYPIQKQELSTIYLRDHAHLRTRTEAMASMVRLRHSTMRSLHSHFEHQGFTYAHTPILTANDCEGAGEAFKISPTLAAEDTSQQPEDQEFFSRPTFLTVSAQLHLEALSSSLARVYTLSPCFRAERSQTNRHLAEFWMLEAEWAFTQTLDDLTSFVEGTLKAVLNMDDPNMAFLQKNLDPKRRIALANASRPIPWNRIAYSDAISELVSYHQTATRKFTFEPMWGKTLQSEHERWIAEELFGGPVFVTDYPVALKPFYMRLNDDEKTVGCFDLLIPHVGELVGGSLREERYAPLERALRAHDLSREEYEWYLDLRRFGGAPHGGFGMGFERLISWMSGIENIRECIPMPRWAGRMIL